MALKVGGKNVLKHASIYKRISLFGGLVTLNVSKQGVSASVGPRGAKVRVPLVNTYADRKPQVHLQKTVAGVRLQYRQGTESLVDDVKGLIAGAPSTDDLESKLITGSIDASGLEALSGNYADALQQATGYETSFSPEYARTSLLLGYVVGRQSKKAQMPLEEIEPELSYRPPLADEAAARSFYAQHYQLWNALGVTLGAKKDTKRLGRYLSILEKQQGI